MTATRYKVSRAKFCDLARGFKRRLAKVLPGSRVKIEWSSDAVGGQPMVSVYGSCAPGMRFDEGVRVAGGRFLEVAEWFGGGGIAATDEHDVDFVRAKRGAR